MRDTEGWAVNAVERVIMRCPHLRPEIAKGDRTPITDGFIEIYQGTSSRRDGIVSRVPVQVKGHENVGRRKISGKSISYSIEREVLEFFRNNGGGIYFCVFIHPDLFDERVFAGVLNPFKLDRIIESMKARAKSKIVKLDLVDDLDQFEKRVNFAAFASKQDPRQRLNSSMLSRDFVIEVHSPDGFDLSRPAKLSIEDRDLAVILNVDGMRLHVDIDLQYTPQSYLEHEAEYDVACGGIVYARPLATQLDDSTGRIRLGAALTLLVEEDGDHLTSHLELDAEGSFTDHLTATRFFHSLALQRELTIAGQPLKPSGATPAVPAGLPERLELLENLDALFTALGVDPRDVFPSEITPRQMNFLEQIHHAMVENEELRSSTGQPGRIDVGVGNQQIVLMVFNGSSEGLWKIHDPFDPGMRNKFRFYYDADTPDSDKLWGTAYDVLDGPEMARTLNLKLDQVVDSYRHLEEPVSTGALANRTLLHLIEAADLTSGRRSMEFLRAASALDSWLLELYPADHVHRVNRWQIDYRIRGLDPHERNDIRSLRRELTKLTATNAGQLEACCAILLGDPEDIEFVLARLDPQEASELKSWPIWSLVSKAGVPGTERPTRVHSP